jgi:hypothetical protein
MAAGKAGAPGAPSRFFSSSTRIGWVRSKDSGASNAFIAHFASSVNSGPWSSVGERPQRTTAARLRDNVGWPGNGVACQISFRPQCSD